MDPLPLSDTEPFLPYNFVLLRLPLVYFAFHSLFLYMDTPPFRLYSSRLAQTSFEPKLVLYKYPSNLDPLWAQNPDSQPIRSLSLHN
jgi:hypothetical protein